MKAGFRVAKDHEVLSRWHRLKLQTEKQDSVMCAPFLTRISVWTAEGRTPRTPS